MFNATDMTTGERLVLGTSVPNVLVHSAPHGFAHVAHVSATDASHRDLVVDYQARPFVADMDLAVAARLSASFPYVTPASHRGGDGPGGAEYVLDGGYIDNYGTETLVEWLEPLIENGHHPLEVDIVRIVAFPEGKTVENGGHHPLLPQ